VIWKWLKNLYFITVSNQSACWHNSWYLPERMFVFNASEETTFIYVRVSRDWKVETITTTLYSHLHKLCKQCHIPDHLHRWHVCSNHVVYPAKINLQVSTSNLIFIALGVLYSLQLEIIIKIKIIEIYL
jgi:hypothetical protein